MNRYGYVYTKKVSLRVKRQRQYLNRKVNGETGTLRILVSSTESRSKLTKTDKRKHNDIGQKEKDQMYITTQAVWY